VVAHSPTPCGAWTLGSTHSSHAEPPGCTAAHPFPPSDGPPRPAETLPRAARKDIRHGHEGEGGGRGGGRERGGGEEGDGDHIRQSLQLRWVQGFTSLMTTGRTALDQAPTNLTPEFDPKSKVDKGSTYTHVPTVHHRAAAQHPGEWLRIAGDTQRHPAPCPGTPLQLEGAATTCGQSQRLGQHTWQHHRRQSAAGHSSTPAIHRW
jgi:hypothetical protein